MYTIVKIPRKIEFGDQTVHFVREQHVEFYDSEGIWDGEFGDGFTIRFKNVKDSDELWTRLMFEIEHSLFWYDQDPNFTRTNWGIRYSLKDHCILVYNDRSFLERIHDVWRFFLKKIRVSYSSRTNWL